MDYLYMADKNYPVYWLSFEDHTDGDDHAALVTSGSDVHWLETLIDRPTAAALRDWLTLWLDATGGEEDL